MEALSFRVGVSGSSTLLLLLLLLLLLRSSSFLVREREFSVAVCSFCDDEMFEKIFFARREVFQKILSSTVSFTTHYTRTHTHTRRRRRNNTNNNNNNGTENAFVGPSSRE